MIGVGSTSLLAAALGGCGARTELGRPELCPTDGLERPCQDECGAGTQICGDGVWGTCQVPERQEACTNVCGTGQRSCVAGTWTACTVAPVVRACSTECGQGVETCSDGDWRECDVPEVQRACSSACGSGNETCRFGKWGKCDAPQPHPPRLEAIVRDFSPKSHKDFESSYKTGLDPGIVEPKLGADGKPVYASATRTPSTTDAAHFYQWYHDDPSVNRTMLIDLQLAPSADEPGQFEYQNLEFFPIDDQLFGNEGRDHNYHFTLEASTTFKYRGGEVFAFEGDDDMWVFINYQLALDLGGLHNSLPDSIELDGIAATHGLQIGEEYPLHFFFAERHTVASHFTIRTTIAEPGSCD
jgi:fibro-slime domain-containing protein